jgi:hypothetical protein
MAEASSVEKAYGPWKLRKKKIRYLRWWRIYVIVSRVGAAVGRSSRSTESSVEVAVGVSAIAESSVLEVKINVKESN